MHGRGGGGGVVGVVSLRVRPITMACDVLHTDYICNFDIPPRHIDVTCV